MASSLPTALNCPQCNEPLVDVTSAEDALNNERHFVFGNHLASCELPDTTRVKLLVLKEGYSYHWTHDRLEIVG